MGVVDRVIDTDEFYALSCEKDWVQTAAIARNREWASPTKWGDLQITVNLSKPEKDPRAIAEAGASANSSAHGSQIVGGNPALRTGACQLCVCDDDVACGYARQLGLGGEQFAMWYSPYAYYREHCIVMSWEHRPMHIDHATVSNLVEFVGKYPTYFMGSNADLPIVGGSILAHDHYQGGRHRFPMDDAPVVEPFCLRGFSEVEAGIIAWPVSTVRLVSTDAVQLVAAADAVMDAWKAHSDVDAGIVCCEPGGERHNTVTPIARRQGDLFVLDLALRCNITSPDRPLGVFHPRPELHHIKKENIGLIEVMGRAILPPRLAPELDAVCRALVSPDVESALAADERCAVHARWALDVSDRRGALCEADVERVVRDEVAEVFSRVLEDAGVFKWDGEGALARARFIDRLVK